MVQAAAFVWVKALLVSLMAVEASCLGLAIRQHRLNTIIGLHQYYITTLPDHPIGGGGGGGGLPAKK